MSNLSEALERFDQAAKRWGWEEDQGYISSDIDAAYKEYISSKVALMEAVDAAILAERSACAKIAEDFSTHWGVAYKTMTDQIAEAIRR